MPQDEYSIAFGTNDGSASIIQIDELIQLQYFYSHIIAYYLINYN